MSTVSFLINKLTSLEATLVRNSADLLTYLLTGVTFRATNVAKKSILQGKQWPCCVQYVFASVCEEKLRGCFFEKKSYESNTGRLLR